MMKGEEAGMKDRAGLHWAPQSSKGSTVFQVNRRQKVETTFLVLNLTNVKTNKQTNSHSRGSRVRAKE